jgi:hypothetical protein
MSSLASAEQKSKKVQANATFDQIDALLDTPATHQQHSARRSGSDGDWERRRIATPARCIYLSGERYIVTTCGWLVDANHVCGDQHCALTLMPLCW